jgi:squalene cyclase
VVSVAGQPANAAKDPKRSLSVRKALDYLAAEQRRQGYWEANGGQYRVAMTANAMACEGSTTTRGRYSKNIRLAVDYLLSLARPNGLIVYTNDYYYTMVMVFRCCFSRRSMAKRKMPNGGRS